jgi:gluconokinase
MSARIGPHVLIMGVCGTGKSSVAGRLAALTGGALIEADDFHVPGNVAQMASGVPLTDAQRWPWLDAVGAAARAAAADGPVVIACSALKRAYRDRLRAHLHPLALVHLAGDPTLIGERLAGRSGHFMPPSLLASQLSELEPPHADEGALLVDVALTPAAQDALIHDFLQKLPARANHIEARS